MGFNLDDYEPVDARIGRFYFDHPAPEGRIHTLIVDRPDAAGSWVVRAEVWIGDVLVATGYAEEVPGQGNVNKTSALENGETSAVGRALANAGYSPRAGERATREEMENARESSRQFDELKAGAQSKVDRLDDAHAEQWAAWKQQHPGWHQSVTGMFNATAYLNELLADQGVDPFLDAADASSSTPGASAAEGSAPSTTPLDGADPHPEQEALV